MDSEKRLIAAIAISVLILVAFSYLTPDRAPEPGPRPEPVASDTTPDGPRADEPFASAEDEPASAEPGERIEAQAEETIVVDNGVFEVALTNRGGAARGWTLRDYTTGDGRPLQLLPRHVEEDAPLPLSLALDDEGLAARLNRSLFRFERSALDDPAAPGERIRFSWSSGDGYAVEKVYEFRRNDYLVGVEVAVTDRGRRLPARLTVGPGFAAQEPDSTHSNYYYESQASWNVGGRVTRKKRGKLGEHGGFSGPVHWAGLEDQYFTALILPNDTPATVEWRQRDLAAIAVPTPGEAAAEPEPRKTPIVAVSIGERGGLLFVGPKRYELMRSIGGDRQLQRAVWFSSQDWLRVIVKYIFLGLVWIHDHVANNWGLAIILATVVLRLVLFPVNQYSMVSMKKTQIQMSKLQPKIKAIRNKYKKVKDAQSRQKMNEEMMALYRKEGVNPMGGVSGCLPLLAQFPILIGFYNMLTVAVELRGAPFVGWVRDLSQEDPYWILPILMAVTMFAQQKLAMTKVKDPQQLQQQRVMLFMPIVFGFICLQMPSGLVLYWFVNNVLGMGQQWLVNRHAGRLEAAAQKA
ncbi:MAG TPA: membrane protein insertase YidC [Candidatus Polarisedimenticolaceae bacterium]|nr:membrane protein insertase YidC [Candidatus Polarisedimenticolaceae bacterium]